MRDRCSASWSLVANAALTAPQRSWPRTTNNGVLRCDPAYCKLPAPSGERTLPATRTTNSSPRPASKINSGTTRESLHPRMVANGCWPSAKLVKSAHVGLDRRVAPLLNRSFPETRRSSACSAERFVWLKSPSMAVQMRAQIRDNKTYFLEDLMATMKG